MKPAYSDYDFGFIWRFSNTYERYAVILYTETPGRANISRIVGLPGEHIEYRSNQIFIDGNVLDMSKYWINEPRAFGKLLITLNEDVYALLSDNRHDAETLKIISSDKIQGKFIYLPFIR